MKRRVPKRSAIDAGGIHSRMRGRNSRTVDSGRTALLLLSLLMLSDAVQAQFLYIIENDSVTITGYTGSGGLVTIPENIEGWPVTTIGDFAFLQQGAVERVVIPGTVTRIGEFAFAGCGSLFGVDIPASATVIGRAAFAGCSSLVETEIPKDVSSIGDGAFEDCARLTNISIPDGMTHVGLRAFMGCAGPPTIAIPAGLTWLGDGAFARCANLETFTVAAGNSLFSSHDGVLFNHDQRTLIACPANKAGEYAVPDSVTNIADMAFAGCARLTSIQLPDGVVRLGGASFADCVGLTSIRLPDGVTSIGNLAFSGCTGLISVTIPAAVILVGGGAFNDCDALTGIYFLGDAPRFGRFPVSAAVLYYLPGTIGWETSLPGYPKVLWDPEIRTDDGDFGVSGNQFGFNITARSDLTVAVEGSVNLVEPDWTIVETLTLTGGSARFNDPQWTEHPRRFYRLRSP